MSKMLTAIGMRPPVQGAAALLLFFTLGFCSALRAAINEERLPQPKGLVSDFARKLSPATKQEIEFLLLNFRSIASVEIAVVTIPFENMQGSPIEEYALRLGRQWGVGRDSQKRALLLLVAIKPPNAQGVYSGGTRLEVSRHLEGDIPDILAGELIRRMRDDFVAGRFDKALMTGMQTILATLSQRLAVSMEGIDPSQAVRQPVPQTAARQGLPYPVIVSGDTQASNSSFSEMIFLIVLMSIVGLIFYAISRGLRGADPGGPIGLLNTGSSDASSWSRSSNSNSTGSELGWFGGGGDASAGGGASDFGGFSGGGDSGGGGGSDFGGFSGGGDFGGGGASDSW